jgi:hypothetical protein
MIVWLTSRVGLESADSAQTLGACRTARAKISYLTLPIFALFF